MKRTIVLILTLFALSVGGAFGQADAPTKEGPQMTFVGPMSHDFGEFRKGGESRSHTFEFVNDGTAPLVVVKASSSCRCISVKYPRRPVKSGEKGSVVITYDPKDEGVFNKGVHIQSNIAGGTLTLFVKGVVK
ncbi:MAG: DUF1573 domain-containing protein [Tidjanibacter sp.]|nr:DUF1573 domain-containing protein [Tidjanibacter sp.]